MTRAAGTLIGQRTGRYPALSAVCGAPSFLGPTVAAIRRILCIFTLLAMLMHVSTAAAQDDQATSGPTAQPASPQLSWLHAMAGRETLTDDLCGVGKALADTGFSVRLGLLQVLQRNVHGGLSTHREAGMYSGRYDLECEADLEQLAKLSGARLVAHVRGGWSEGIDPGSVGGLTAVNTVAVGNLPISLWQLFYEQGFLGDKVTVRFGKIDLTNCLECCDTKSCFDGNLVANDEATQFLNSYLVNNPTIPFQEPGLGALVHLEPVEGWYLAAACVDANAKATETGFNTAFHGKADFFAIWETGMLPKLPSARGKLQGGYRIGLWYDPQRKERFDGGVKRDDVGFYASCDQVLWKENPQEDDSQGLSAFGRYGMAHADVSEIKSFWSGGLQYQGLIPSRDNDVVGLGVAQSLLSRQAGFDARNETVVEVYYNIAVTPWLHVSPDVQYIFSPGGQSGHDAVAVGLRAQIDL